MRINVHAGHNPDGKIACGAVGLVKESTEARNVKNHVINMLRQLGHEAYDCTCDDGKSQSDVLKKIVSACNSRDVDLDVSIHFNAGANDAKGNGKITGTEVLIYSTGSEARKYADSVCKCISALGFKNRGTKINDQLYFLRQTEAPAMLIECCFVDDKDDIGLYNAYEMAKAIVKGITGQSGGQMTENNVDKTLYRVQVGAYGVKANAEAMQNKLKAAGFDAFITRA